MCKFRGSSAHLWDTFAVQAILATRKLDCTGNELVDSYIEHNATVALLDEPESMARNPNHNAKRQQNPTKPNVID